MKKIVLSFSILSAVALFGFGCKKEKNVAPEPDLELQSSIDVSYAMQVISDIDMICSFMAENKPPVFYNPSLGDLVPNLDTTNKIVKLAFANTTCLDGRVRDGSFFLNYEQVGVRNTSYFRDFGYKSKLTFSAYKVDGWKIKTTGVSQITFANLVAPVNYDPKTTNLSWSFAGDITLEHPSDTTKNMYVNFNLVKTLLNTSTATVFPTSKQQPINWPLANIDYKGVLFGTTSRNVPFKYEINSAEPIARIFTCTPNKVYGVGVAAAPPFSVTPRFSEYHPFINGTAALTTSTLYPRVVHYGPEVRVENAAATCDNSGAVTIKGISYPIDFKTEYK